MKLFILEEEFTLPKEISSIEVIFEYIKQALEETENNFSHMIIDDVEVYDEFEIYIEDNIGDIEKVEVVMLTLKEMIVDNLSTIEAYVRGAVPIIKDLSNRFKKGPGEKELVEVSELIEGIGFIFHTVSNIDSVENLNEMISDYQIWNKYVREVKSLEKILENLELGIKNTDNNLVADMLLQEIVPIFENIEEKLRVLLDIKQQVKE